MLQNLREGQAEANTLPRSKTFSIFNSLKINQLKIIFKKP